MRHSCRRYLNVLPHRPSSWTSIVCLLVIALGAHLAQGQSPAGGKPKKARTVEDYEVRSLKEIVEQTSTADSRGNKEETMLVHSNLFPSRVKVAYTGRTRPFLQIKQEVMRQWARLYAGYPEGFTRPYESEMLFVEDGKEYWLAIRTELLELFKKEIKQGEAVDLFLIRVGTAKTSADWELVLLVERFQKAK